MAALIFLGTVFPGCPPAQDNMHPKGPEIPPPPSTSSRENFHIYLCLGQSNMEGYNGQYQRPVIEEEDLEYVDPRFRLLAAVNMPSDIPSRARQKGKWYVAYPPLCRGNSGLCPADYFGRTMVANLPKEIKVGVINVSVAGCKIELFDEDVYQSYVATAEVWLQDIVNIYGGNPYQRLLELAKTASQVGVIKGILLHQGESNTDPDEWRRIVKKVYDRLLNDLDIEPDSLPLLAGELVNGSSNGRNVNMIAKLPEAIPNAHIISSSGCGFHPDSLHFTAAGYREMGRRYAVKMLEIMGD
jgi:hypothetical protein